MVLNITTTSGYALGLTGLFTIMALRSLILRVVWLLFPPILTMIWKLRPFIRLARRTSDWLTNHLVYRSFFRSGSSVDIYNRAHTIISISYLTANLSCILFQMTSWSEACARTGTLAVINMILLYSSPCFGFIADILGLPLRIHHQVHASAGYMVGILASLHAVGTVIVKGSFATNNVQNLLALLIRRFTTSSILLEF